MGLGPTQVNLESPDGQSNSLTNLGQNLHGLEMIACSWEYRTAAKDVSNKPTQTNPASRIIKGK